jgi:xylan 1,4-beta-xylosidase
MIEQQLRYADLRDAHPKLKGLPIHVEEWGETSGGTTGVSDKKPTADVRNSEYGAAFLADWVGRHIRMRRENDRTFASFTFCASGYEKPPERDFMGYRTLHTKSGFHKPILNAYTLLGKLAPELVKADTVPSGGHVSAFASRETGRVTVVVVNYQHDQIDSSKGESSAVALKIETPWPPAAKVTVSHWRIDGRHSNAYTAFKEIGSPASPTPEQIAAVKARMGLELLEPARQTDCAELGALAFELPCNAVSLVEVVRED